MPLVRTDLRAIFNSASLIALITLIENRVGFWSEPDAMTWSPDRIVTQMIWVGALYAVLFFFGSIEARRREIRSRSAYTTIGAAAALPAYLIGIGLPALVDAAGAGRLLLLLLVPICAGSVTGFLYHRSAGYETAGDNPETLSDGKDQPESAAADAAVHATSTARYYEGPLQVQTSSMAVLIAALVGGAAHGLIVFGSLFVDPLPSGAMPPLFRNNPGAGTLAGIIGLAAPYYLFVRLAHTILQKRGASSMKSYVKFGALTPVILGCGLAVVGLGLAGPLITAQFILPSMVAMAAYHRMAGLEPLDLPEDIEVRDARALVGADHVRRRTRRIIDA